MTTEEENQSKPQFYMEDNKTGVFITEDGKGYRFDFDKILQDLLTEDAEKWMQEASAEMEKKGTKGSFTEYCGGEVTQACIDKAKKSDDPKIRKKAIFAENARKISKKKSKDFEDEQVYKRTSSVPPEITNKKNMTNEDEHYSEDLTEQQYRENYWKETKETKLDGSTMMMETRIAKCVEAGGSQEECSRKVKAEMKQKGSENTNTEDMDKKEETKKVEVCEKEYDFLKEKYEELKKIKEEKAKLETDMVGMKDKFAEWGTIMQKIEEERALELAQKREERIKKISADFILPSEELEEEKVKDLIEKPSLEKILDFTERILTKAGKKAKEDTNKDETTDLTDYLSEAQKAHEKLMNHYDLRRVE